MPMEPNRTRQVLQDLARAFNKLASELTADLSYAASEIESLRREVQKLRSSPGKGSRTNGSSKKSSSMEQRRAVRLRRAAVPIRKLRTGPRLVLNRLNQPTSQGRSSFRKSLSAPAPQLSQALQETTEGASQPTSARFGQLEDRPISASLVFEPLKISLHMESLRSYDFA